MNRLVFRFNSYSSQNKLNNNKKDILGGKGVNLNQMAKLGLPVPPGFTISTKVCDFFYKNNQKLPKQLIKQIKSEIKVIEKITKKNLAIYQTLY